MKQYSPLSIQKIASFIIFVLFCGVFANAQDLKSRPQGNDLVKLNGTFDIPASNNGISVRSQPLSVAATDLDSDGINDLIIGYKDSISIQRGDINAFAPQVQDAWEAIRDVRFISPFQSESRSFELPISADFVQAGDFTRDGKVDVITASRSSNLIILLEGDGQGNFTGMREIFVGANVTAMITGDVNRLDGLPDLIVGAGNEVLIYQGLGDIFNTLPKSIFVSNFVENLAVGQLDASDFADIAVGNGNQISIISGSDSDNEVSNLTQNYFVKSMAVGDFVPDRAFRQEIAALDENGSIHIIVRGDLDTRPVSRQEHLANQVREMLAKKMPVPQRILSRLSQKELRTPIKTLIETKNQNWTEYDRFSGVETNATASADTILTSGRLSNYGEDLIILDSSNKEIVVMPLVFNDDTSEKVSYVGKRQSVKFTLENSPKAAIVSRLNFDGDKDLLILENGKFEPTSLLTAPEASFTVDSNGDQVDSNPGNGVCATAGGQCTLRAAIMEANRLAGNDSITINSGINITLSTGKADNDGFGENSASHGDLDIFCVINATEDICTAPGANNNDLSIIGAVGGNTISSGTFSPSSSTGVTTDRVFDIGMDGVFGGGFGGSEALDITMSNLTIQNGNVREDFNVGFGTANFARGGAIRMDGFGFGGTRGSLVLTSVTINNNQADHDTGGIFDQYATISFTSVTATSNIGKAGPGGALQFLASTPATLTVQNSSFTSNESRTGTVFGSPANDTDGGAIAANHDTNTGTITNTNFTNNISFDDGGALKIFNGAVTITGGTQSGNTSRDDGGAVWGDIDTVGAARFLTLSGVTIRGNTSNSDNIGGGDGGGIFRDRGTLNVTNCTIGGTGGGQPNNAPNGGGIAHAFRVSPSATNVTTVNINNGSITGNNATNNGGGVNFNGTGSASSSTLNVGSTNSVDITENNSNIHGGGFAFSGGSTINLTRAEIHGNDADKDNNATGDGGGIYHNNTAGSLTIAGTVTLGQAGQGNTGENGGAIHHSIGTLTLNNPGISNNSTDVHAGGLFVSGGVVNVNSITFASNNSTNGTEVRLTGGTTNFSGTVTIPGEISIAGGTLAAGSSTVNLGEDFHFTSGTFTAGTSTFNFNGTGAQQIYGGTTPTFNNLTDSNTSNPLIFNNNTNVNGTLTVNANAILSPVAAVVIGGTGTLTGNGTVRVNRATGTNDFLTQYTMPTKTLTNLLVDYVGGSIQGFSGTTYGNVRLNNSNGANLSANATVDGTLTLQNGTLNVQTNTLILNNGITASGGGVLSSAATGTVNYNQSSNGQTVLTANYGNLTFSNFNKTLPSATVGIAGTFTPGSATGHTITGNTINFNGSGAQTIPAFTYNNLQTATSGVKTTSGAVNVNGNATVGAGTTLSVASGSTLTVTGTLTNNSIIQGRGTIVNNFTNPVGSVVAPGLSPGILNITGNYTNSGNFNVELGGTTPGLDPNGHDQLVISGTATIGGTLNVTLTNGFNPAPGDTFLILNAASSTGDFTTINLPNIAPNVWGLGHNKPTGDIRLFVFGPNSAEASISGKIISPNGTGISKAQVSITDQNGITRTFLSNSFGYYQIENVPVGASYVISVNSKRYTFAPRVIDVSESISDLDFIADPK